MSNEPNRIYHTGLKKYGDIVGLSNEWVTARFDGEKGVGCWEVNAPYIKIFNDKEIFKEAELSIDNTLDWPMWKEVKEFIGRSAKEILFDIDKEMRKEAEVIDVTD